MGWSAPLYPSKLVIHMNKYIKILLLVILLDTVITVGGINLGLLFELNPLMAYLISHSMSLFICVKLLWQSTFLKLLETGMKKINGNYKIYIAAIVVYLLLFSSGFLVYFLL